MHPSPPHQLPSALLAAEFVFVHKHASVPSLVPLYRGPYLVLEQRDKFFSLQLGSRADVVTVDLLKLAFSEDPISAALPPVLGGPALRAPKPLPSPPTAAVPAQSSVKKSVWFQLLPPVPARSNPGQTVQDRSNCSAISPPVLLGGTPVAD